ncbi:MAG: hypothetical protein ACYC96_01980 [Fimbriimonadaceae bacterium]
MPAGLRESLTPADARRLREAMNWIVPADSSDGAGSEAGVARLLELVDSLPEAVGHAYLANVGTLTEGDLGDPANAFAVMFLEHVRDVYYAYPDTGSWADIGFDVGER